MSDIYETLGIPRDASPKAVQSAYRALAKKYHPDRNVGDEDAKAKYAAVDLAYRILSDPERRAKYDATGEVDSPKPDNRLAEVMSVLSPCLFAVLKEVVKQGGEVKEEDIVYHMRHALTHGEKEMQKGRAEMLKDKATLEVVADRFEFDGADEENILEAAVRDHLRQLEERLQQMDREIVRMGKAIEYLKKCRYKADAKKLITSIPDWMFKVSTSASSTW